MEKIILASGSPRRRELLSRMGIPFIVKPQEVDETFNDSVPESEAVRLADKKVRACLAQGESGWILGADTFIFFNECLIGKPESADRAREMLRNLSGQTHRVYTGLALHVPEHGSPGQIVTEYCCTEVRFSLLDEEEIEQYIDCGEWRGAAGAYRIQESGEILVESISGSYSNVMGLPINTFYGMLKTNNYNFRI